MRALEILQLAPFFVALATLLAQRVLLGLLVVPFLRQRGVGVPAPAYPWRMRRALEDYARLCEAEGLPPRGLRAIRWLGAAGLAAMVVFVGVGVLVTARDR